MKNVFWFDGWCIAGVAFRDCANKLFHKIYWRPLNDGEVFHKINWRPLNDGEMFLEIKWRGGVS